MDLTEDFRSIAAKHARDTNRPRLIPEHQTDAFIKEGYRLYHQMLEVQNYLQRTRRAYLSSSSSKVSQSDLSRRSKKAQSTANVEVAHLTDKQRDEIDYEVKRSIREASDRVKELESLESQRRETIEKHTSFLDRLLPDLEEKARSDLLATHRSSITWYLNNKLYEINQRHAETKTIRLTREEEKRLAMNSAVSFTPRYAYEQESHELLDATNSAIETDLAVRETLLSEAQLQEYEFENTQILNEFQDQLGQVKSVQSKLLEIAELSNELQSHLVSQTEMTDRLMTEAEQTTIEVTKGNEQLGKAKERNKNVRLFLVTFFLVLAFVLLFLDWYAA